MSFLDRLEKKYGKYAIKNFAWVITVIYAIGFLLSMANPLIYYTYLSLDVPMILQGQIWRIVTFIFYPPSTSIFWILLSLYFYYLIGTALERAWGAFRFNVYYISGMLFHVLGAFVLYFILKVFFGTGFSVPLGTEYLNYSLFFAFAALYPDMEFRLFFIIPIKAKWLAIIDALFFGYSIALGLLPRSLTNLSASEKTLQLGSAAAAIISLFNFLIFFAGMKKKRRPGTAQRQFQREMAKNTQKTVKQRAKREEKNIQQTGARHCCTVCGRTELTNPELTFRYCSKCSGAKEYCEEHLFTHEHV